MLNIPDGVKNLFKLDSCPKNFRVHFPNGEMDDLTNEDMVQESVQFSESICSQSTFKFGKSESSTIEFETVGVRNMMGMKIECGIEIDCTSLGSAWAAQHPVDDTLPFLTPQTLWVYGDASESNNYTGNPVSFSGSAGDEITSLSLPINLTQSGSGTPSPSNVRPITGLTGLTIYVSPTQDVADATSYPVTWQTEAGTVYSGTINIVTGVLTVDKVGVDMGTLTWLKPTATAYLNFVSNSIQDSALIPSVSSGDTLLCSCYRNDTVSASTDNYIYITKSVGQIRVKDTSKASLTKEQFKSAMSGMTLVYELAEPVTYRITGTELTVLTGQNYIWSSSDETLSATVEELEKTLYYRVPYGRFTVRECPRDHQAMTHRKVTAYTDTRLLGTEYQKMLFSSNGFENKYTPKFQNMFYASIGRNNESLILSAGYTKTAHDAFSSLIDSLHDDIIQFDVSGVAKYFKLQVYRKTFTIGGSSQGAYTTDALYGIEGIENVDVSNLVEPIAKVLVDDYGVSEEDAYNYSTYDIWSRFPNSHPEMYNIATVTKPKVIGFKAQKDLSGGGSVIFNESQYVDLTGMSGLYCINPDREGFITTVSVLAGITLTPWSSDNPVSGHAIGDPVSTYGSGFDEAFLNQYTAPSGSAFDTELKLKPTGSEKTNVSGAPKRYWFTDAVDISKLMTDYLEVSALFAAQNRTGGLRVFSLDNSVLKEQLSAGEYSEFWWDEYDVSPIGKIKYILTKKEEEEETTYTFGSGQSVYDLTQNEFFKQFKKSQSEIETFLDVSFIPKLGAVAFTPIELTVGNGLPYIEAGDYVQATSEDGVDAKSFVLTHTISGIQHLTETIESSGGDLVNSVFSEGN